MNEGKTISMKEHHDAEGIRGGNDLVGAQAEDQLLWGPSEWQEQEDWRTWGHGEETLIGWEWKESEGDEAVRGEQQWEGGGKQCPQEADQLLED